MSEYSFCKVSREDHVLIVTLNRPDVMNSLHRPANLELDKVFDDFAADPGSVGGHHFGRRRKSILGR